MNKIYNKIKSFWYGLFYGMKSANDIIVSSNTTEDESIGVHKQVHDNRVSKALLKGEVTQAVKELRYRTYKVDREAKLYEYFSPTLVKKYNMKDESKFVTYDKSDNLKVLTIQENLEDTEGIDTELNRNTDTTNYVEKKSKEYTIKIERDFLPRFKIEEYTNRIVVKETEDENIYVVDFYISKYPKQDNLVKSKSFITELNRMMNGGRSSDSFDFKRFSFLTYHAYRLPDMIYFGFRNPIFLSINEYDGNYVIKFRCILERTEDEVEKFHCKEMEEKYKNNESKEMTLDLSDFNERREYVCEKCGKVMVYDPILIEELNSSKGREIDDNEYNEEKESVLSYLDAEISEQTTGHIFCKNCLKEFLEKEENNVEK